ncbi:MAG: hypothetical protein P8X74_03685 [Reinekea sp.]
MATPPNNEYFNKILSDFRAEKFVKNLDRKWFQFWKPKMVSVSPLTTYMNSVLGNFNHMINDGQVLKRSLETPAHQDYKGFMSFFKPKMIKNPNREWWQFWKPKMIPVQDEPQMIEIDIKRVN